MDKINIYVPDRIETILENDASMFEMYKKDGRTINKNRFLGRLIIGYYDDFVSEAKKAMDKIVSMIDMEKLSLNEKEEIADVIFRNVVAPSVSIRKEKNPARLSLKPTKDTEFLIKQIVRNLDNKDSLSQYFCRMFMSYCNKPFSEREQIIFKDNYDTIQSACNAKRSIIFRTIWNPMAIHEVIPYKVIRGSEELYNYLLCAEINSETGIQEARSYRLNRIDKINYSKSLSHINGTVKHRLDMMIQYGPQYMINDDEEACVRLNESGIKSFNRIYHGRPRPYRESPENGYLYLYFKCSKDQLFFYFRRFSGKEAKILAPEWLKKQIIRFHQESVDAYLQQEV